MKGGIITLIQSYKSGDWKQADATVNTYVELGWRAIGCAIAFQGYSEEGKLGVDPVGWVHRTFALEWQREGEAKFP